MATKSELTEGAKFDQGKCRIELFPPEALIGPSWILTFGAQKYADRNWEKGISYGRVFGALMRHLWAWWHSAFLDTPASSNVNFLFGPLDTETEYSHLWHAGCCLAFLIAYEARGMAGFDDRARPQ